MRWVDCWTGCKRSWKWRQNIQRTWHPKVCCLCLVCISFYIGQILKSIHLQLLTPTLSFSRFENQGEVVDLSQLYVTLVWGRIPVGSNSKVLKSRAIISNISRRKCDFIHNQICNGWSWDLFHLICLNPVIGFLWILNFTLSAAYWALHSTHSWHGFFVDVTCFLKLPKPGQRLHPVSPVKKTGGAWRPNSLERPNHLS